MTSVLLAAGFKDLESLQEFSTRFPSISSCLDSDLQKIWIFHKNSQDIPKLDEIHLHQDMDYHQLYITVKKRLRSSGYFISLLTEFTVTSIFHKIYKHFKSYLTAYLFSNCYLFYNWGINSFEPLIDHFEIHSQIRNCEKKLSDKRMKKKNPDHLKFYFSNNKDFIINENPPCYMVKEEKRKRGSLDDLNNTTYCSKSSTKSVSSKSVAKAVIKAEPFFELKRNKNDPYQDSFNMNKILYDLKERAKWSKYHVFSGRDADKLMMFIIQLPPESGMVIENKLKHDCKNWTKLKEILKSFMQKHEGIERNNGYGRILKKHLRNVRTTTSGKLVPIEKSIICSYVLDILRRVLPIELFGCNRLRKKFFSCITTIINGCKEENFIWHPFLHVFYANKSSLTWCLEISDSCNQYQMVLKTFKFIIIHYVFVVLRNNFYVTETGSFGYGLRYYTKSNMESALQKCFNKILSNGRLKILKKRDHDLFTVERKWVDTGIIDGKDLKKKSKQTMCKGTEFKQAIARIRFLPKNDWSDEMRIVTNVISYETKFLSSFSRSEELLKLFKSRCARRNKKLFYVKLFLEYLVDKTGFGIHPLPGNPRLEAAWKKVVYLKENFGKVYFVKADIADAFDSVVLDLLIKILEEIVQKVCSPMIQLKRIIEWTRAKGKILKSVRFSFSNRPRENSVIISRSIYLHHEKKLPEFSGSKFLEIIRQVVTEQRVEVKGKVFKVIKGLAQGGVGKHSRNLCEIYFSAMDRLHFKEFIDCNNSVLLRGVDDYLYATSDKEKAKKFLEIVRAGITGFNIRFNNTKLKSNLIEGISEVPYLGLVFNFNDMSVLPNYSKYEGKNLLYTMKLSDTWGNNHFNKNCFLEKKSLFIRRLKLQPILFNKGYNCLNTMRQIVFEGCLVQSVCVMTLAKYLYHRKTKNDLVVCKVLLSICNKIKNLVNNRSGISKNEVTWLFFFAALNMFRKSSGQFKSLLVILRFHLEKCERKFIKSGSNVLLNFLKSDAHEHWKKNKDYYIELASNTKPYRCLRDK